MADEHETLGLGGPVLPQPATSVTWATAAAIAEPPLISVHSDNDESDPHDSGSCSSEDPLLTAVPFDWYQHPLAYDIVFQTDTAEEADFLEDVLRVLDGLEPTPRPSRSPQQPLHHSVGPGPGAAAAPAATPQTGRREPGMADPPDEAGRLRLPAHRPPKRRFQLLEPACGTGRLAIEMARRGHAVLGYDSCRATVEFARRAAAQARRSTGSNTGGAADFVEGDMARFRVREGSCDLAYNLVSSFKHLASEADALSHLRLVYGALRPGGIYCLGLHFSVYDGGGEGDPAGLSGGDREKWVEARDGRTVMAKIYTSPPSRLTRTEVVRVCLQVTEAVGVRQPQAAASDGDASGPEGAHDDPLPSTSPGKHLVHEFEMRAYDRAQLFGLIAKTDFTILACYDFGYDIAEPRDPREDADQECVLFLLRKPGLAF